MKSELEKKNYVMDRGISARHGAEESVPASAVEKECDAVACELGILYPTMPTLQSIYARKLNKQSIQGNIIYDIMFCTMISYLISCMIYRCREGKRMQEQQTAMHTITVLAARIACMCIFSSQPALISFRGSQMSFAQMMASWRGKLEYPFRKSHPIIRWLPSKPAAWIGENFGQELQIPPKRDVE
jgi:hypothetical protein